MNITLQEITEDTLSDVLALQVRDDQRLFVPSVAVSIAEAHFSRYAWFRAIYADDAPVGFVMLYLDADLPEYTLWRLMIDHRFQGNGCGFQAMKQVIEFVQSLPESSEFEVAFRSEPGNPGRFFEKLGFQVTERTRTGEKRMILTFD